MEQLELRFGSKAELSSEQMASHQRRERREAKRLYVAGSWLLSRLADDPEEGRPNRARADFIEHLHRGGARMRALFGELFPKAEPAPTPASEPEPVETDLRPAVVGAANDPAATDAPVATIPDYELPPHEPSDPYRGPESYDPDFDLEYDDPPSPHP